MNAMLVIIMTINYILVWLNFWWVINSLHENNSTLFFAASNGLCGQKIRKTVMSDIINVLTYLFNKLEGHLIKISTIFEMWFKSTRYITAMGKSISIKIRRLFKLEQHNFHSWRFCKGSIF